MSNTFLLIRFGLEPPRIIAIASAAWRKIDLAVLIKASVVGRSSPILYFASLTLE